MTGQRTNNSSLVGPVTITAAVVGTVQSLLWVVLALVSILMYESVIDVDVGDVATGDNIGLMIYYIYLFKTDVESGKIIVTAYVFNIIIYFYFILSFVWLFISATLLWAFTRDKWQNASNLTGAWACVVILISILDIIVMGLIAHDYNVVADSSTNTILTAIGIVMTLAAKGYILWIVNVVFAVVLAKFSYDIREKDAGRPMSIIDAYATGPLPPWGLSDNSLYDEANAANFEFTNKGFNDDNGVPGYRSNSFRKLPVDNKQPVFSNNLNPLSNGNLNLMNVNNRVKNEMQNSPDNRYKEVLDNNQFILSPQNLNSRKEETPSYVNNTPNERTAKIGNPQGRPQKARPPAPLNIPPPFIPPPDYSPPGSPKIKSALRSNSNYVL